MNPVPSLLSIASLGYRPNLDFEEKRSSVMEFPKPLDLSTVFRKPEQVRRFVIELHPDFHEPCWPRQFYAGWSEKPYRAARTTEINDAASFMNRDSAIRAAKEIPSVPGCNWGVSPFLIPSNQTPPVDIFSTY